MKRKITIGKLMLALAVISVPLGVGLDYLVRGPTRRGRRELIAHHEHVAAYYSREAAREIPECPLEDTLKRELFQAAEWHTLRARRLQQATGFDPDTERGHDAAHDPIDMSLQGWLVKSRMVQSY